MKIACIGGGPSGLFFALLARNAFPSAHIDLFERHSLGDTFGFGVVFSDATLGNIADADPETYAAITEHFAHWDDIDVHYQGEILSSSGHGFSGLSRKTLLQILAERCEGLGVNLHWNTTITDVAELAASYDLVLGADGLNSLVRSQYKEAFEPSIHWRPNRFVWLGSTRPFERAFTFYFKENAYGLWRVHAYQYEEGHSTFIIETTEETWRAAGLEEADEATTVAFCEELFADELQGHSLVGNRSIWRQFPTVKNARWHHENIVIIGDAAHTAHFSIGSGTKLAMEDSVFLVEALKNSPDDIPAALAAYEKDRRPQVESLQRAAQVSLHWFEDTERYMGLQPIQFAFSLLTRSLRITHDNLKVRDPEFIARVDRWFADDVSAKLEIEPPETPPPAMFMPFRLRGLHLQNRVVVSPMCQYMANDGTVGPWHMVHLGSRAVGGAGLIITEMTDVSREGRISPGCAGMYKPEHVEAWANIVTFVHTNSEARIGIQLGHAGRKGSTRLSWEGIDRPLKEGNWPIMAASPIPYYDESQTPRAMTRADMDKVADDFARAAQMSDEAGFDLLELHLAHGYLLASFISPLTNQRADDYGGTLENRLRFPLEVFDRIREVWPDAKPISVRLSAVDWAPGGVSPDDTVAVARLLKERGCDIIDVSSGQTVPWAKPEYGRQFQTPFSDRVRHEVGIPTMAVGNISSYTDVNTILLSGRADLCLMARAHLWDPYWTRHAAQALGHKQAWPGPYSTLNRYTPRFE